MQYWLLKSEPDVYSIDDLARDKKTYWDGVRNYQARNFMRDQMKPGDRVFFYHSNAEPSGIAGVCEVTGTGLRRQDRRDPASVPKQLGAGYPDPSQFDSKDVHYDEDAKKEKPSWFCVDVKYVKKFSRVVALDELKRIKGLEKMPLLQRGQRLSVQPVSEKEWKIIEALV